MKGPQCHFSFGLLNVTMTLKALKPYFYFVTSNENCDKRSLVPFLFTFSEYENEIPLESPLFSF